MHITKTRRRRGLTDYAIYIQTSWYNKNHSKVVSAEGLPSKQYEKKQIIKLEILSSTMNK